MIFCIYCYSARDDAVDLEQREPVISNWLLHPKRTWRDHQTASGAGRGAKLAAEAAIANGDPSGYVLI